MNIGFAGKFTIHKQKVQMQDGAPLLDKDGNQILIGDSERVAGFENLITNGGLNRLGTSNPIMVFYLSADNTEPTITDSSLLSLLGGSTSKIAGGTGDSSITVPPYYVSSYQTNRFAAGVATGNISKVATGWGTAARVDGLWSVALIKDSNGNNTVITKLADEILDITYELRVYLPSVDNESTVTISGVTYKVKVRLSDLKSTWSGNSIAPVVTINSAAMYQENIGAVTSRPSGNVALVSVNAVPYVDGSFESKYVANATIDKANFITGVRSLSLANSGFNAWQVEFSRVSNGAAIPKTSEYSLTLPPFIVKWGRYVAT